MNYETSQPKQPERTPILLGLQELRRRLASIERHSLELRRVITGNPERGENKDAIAAEPIIRNVDEGVSELFIFVSEIEHNLDACHRRISGEPAVQAAQVPQAQFGTIHVSGYAEATPNCAQGNVKSGYIR